MTVPAVFDSSLDMGDEDVSVRPKGVVSEADELTVDEQFEPMSVWPLDHLRRVRRRLGRGGSEVVVGGVRGHEGENTGWIRIIPIWP